MNRSLPALGLCAAAVCVAPPSASSASLPVDITLWGGIKSTSMADLEYETDLVEAQMEVLGMTVVREGTVGVQAGLEAGIPVAPGIKGCVRAAWLGRDGGTLTASVADANGTASLVETLTMNAWEIEAGARAEHQVAPRANLRAGLFAGVVPATADVRLQTSSTGLWGFKIAPGDNTLHYRATAIAAEALAGVAYSIAPRIEAGLDLGWRLAKTGAMKATAGGDSDNNGTVDVSKGDPRKSGDGKKSLGLDFSGLTAVLAVTCRL